jgi:sugar lactone lactonase YvrE
MRAATTGLLALSVTFAGCAAFGPAPISPTPSILVDLDPASADRTVIVESITADRHGLLYLPDRVSGNILRIDPKSPKPVVVARIEPRQINGQAVAANAGSLAFNAQGDLLIAAGPFNEVVRVRAADLDPAKPGVASTFATGTQGANGLVIDRSGNVYVSGGANGTVYRVPAAGGAAQPVAQIERFTRTLPDGRTRQAIVANGLAFDASGALLVADTARGALWKVALGADGAGAPPVLLAQNAMLEGADGVAVDRRGDVWVAVNELNAIVKLTPDGQVQQVARNGVAGPLEFPSGLVFVGDVAYVSNFDVPRRDNLDAGANTARGGIGASVARIGG